MLSLAAHIMATAATLDIEAMLNAVMPMLQISQRLATDAIACQADRISN
jgi:hypothetical protein